jgi:MFS transporter, DHA2 family, multidrug resistance protein
VLGTVIATVYQGKLHLPGLPASVAAIVRSSVAAGVSVAQRAPAPQSSALLAAVHSSYSDGMDVMLWICAGIAIGSAILAALFIPRNAEAPNPAEQEGADGLADVTDAETAGVARRAGHSDPDGSQP